MAVAAVLIAMIAVQAYRPDLLPQGLRPSAKTQVAEQKPVAAPTPPPALPPPAAELGSFSPQEAAPSAMLNAANAEGNAENSMTITKMSQT